MLRTIIFKTLLFTWFIICTPLLLLGLISSNLERQIGIFIAKIVLFLTKYVGGISYRIQYPSVSEDGIPFKHNINSREDNRSIIASKHMSAMEVFILFIHIPNAFFIIKRELLWIPIYGWAFRRLGLIGVNRKKGATNLKKLKEKVTKGIMDGKTLIIFPEGTRVAPQQKIKLKRGLLFLAEQLKLPITPVFLDTGLYWPKHGKITPGTACIYFKKEIPSSATLEEIYENINNKIQL